MPNLYEGLNPDLWVILPEIIITVFAVVVIFVDLFMRGPAKATTLPAVTAAMTRLRTRKRCGRGANPGGHSLTIRPSSAILANSRS